MPDVVYPPAFHRRVLKIEAPGGKAEALSLVVPTVVRPGERFRVKLAVTDRDGYPSIAFGGSVTVARPDSGAEEDVCFTEGEPAVAALEGVSLDREGFFRFRGLLDGREFYSNPVLVKDGAEQRIFWGDPHVHTVLSRCHFDLCRSLNFCYVAARHLTGLDWVAAADHVSNDRCNPCKWKEQVLACNAHDDPPEFVTLPAYEASLRGGAGGDNNVYMLRHADVFVDEHGGGSIKTLCEKMAEKLPAAEFFVAPHHTTRTGKHGEISDDIYPGPALMPVLEIHSKWGTSEYRGNPNPLRKIHPGPAYATDLMAQGLKLGFIAGTDTHATMPSGFGCEPGHIDRLPGLTAVCAGELTREAVFEAIRTRNCYATSLERVYLDVRIAGARPGDDLAWEDPTKPRAIEVVAAARSDIEKIEVIRNGTPIHEEHGTGWQACLSHVDREDLNGLRLTSEHLGQFAYYYVRVTCTSGAQAWSSPVWLRM